MNTEADLRMFDYNTISDIVVTIRYSAREEGTLKGTVNTYLKGLIQSTIAPTDSSSGMVLNRLFSLKHEYSSEWHKMFYPSGGGIHIMNFDINKSQLPFFVQERDVAIGKVYLIGHLLILLTPVIWN
ncbi:MAG: hypothetical protein IPP79_19685 [Chitinophagaceae bacterium]|nr:hypothetical protein [Chitinophagaceae bacterium]